MNETALNEFGNIDDGPPVQLPPDLEVATHEVQSNPWHMPASVWNPVWKKVTGRKVKIAILDTGYNKHVNGPEPIASRSFIRGESVTDGNGHGTHCAGSALGRGGYGTAPEAELIVGKVLSNRGSGSSGGIAAGIRFAIEAGADVISMSLGGGSSYGPTNDAIDAAFRAGVMVNVAAGNSGYRGANTIGWPAKYPGALCCASYQRDGRISSFSSGGRQVDWACPGSQIISFATDGRSYRTMSGTSMATPYGSGVLALIRELMMREGFAEWTDPDQVRAFFKENMKDAGQPGFDNRFGNGIPVADEIIKPLIDENLTFA